MAQSLLEICQEVSDEGGAQMTCMERLGYIWRAVKMKIKWDLSQNKLWHITDHRSNTHRDSGNMLKMLLLFFVSSLESVWILSKTNTCNFFLASTPCFFVCWLILLFCFVVFGEGELFVGWFVKHRNEGCAITQRCRTIPNICTNTDPHV